MIISVDKENVLKIHFRNCYSLDVHLSFCNVPFIPDGQSIIFFMFGNTVKIQLFLLKDYYVAVSQHQHLIQDQILQRKEAQSHRLHQKVTISNWKILDRTQKLWTKKKDRRFQKMKDPNPDWRRRHRAIKCPNQPFQPPRVCWYNFRTRKK